MEVVWCVRDAPFSKNKQIDEERPCEFNHVLDLCSVYTHECVQFSDPHVFLCILFNILLLLLFACNRGYCIGDVKHHIYSDYSVWGCFVAEVASSQPTQQFTWVYLLS